MSKNSKRRNRKHCKKKTMKGGLFGIGTKSKGDNVGTEDPPAKKSFMSNFSFENKVKDAEKDKAAKDKETAAATKYDSYNVTSSNQDEKRLTESALTQQAGIYGEGVAEAKKSLKDQFGVGNIKDDIARSKNVRGALFVAAAASKALAILPGGEYVSAALNMAQTMAAAYTANLKFKELMYDTMTILTNCYKIFSLINRSTDVFLIAIHNPEGLNNLFELLLQRSEMEGTLDRRKIDEHQEKYETTFITALKQAQGNKETNRNKLTVANTQTLEKLASLSNQNVLVNPGKRLLEEDPHYLLYNIHQSSEIKEEIKRKMKDLMGLLLESAPDDVILTLFLDKTLKGRGIGDAVAAECLRRRADKKINVKLEGKIKEQLDKNDKDFLDSITDKMNKGNWLVSVSEENYLDGIKTKLDSAYKKKPNDELLNSIFYLEDKIVKFKLGEKNKDEDKFCYKPGDDNDSAKRIKASQILGAIKEDQTKTEISKELDDAAAKKGFLSRSYSSAKSTIKLAGKAVINPQTYLNILDKANEMSEAEEKMMDVLTSLSVINGLFIVMKAQYDEAMRYYEKHLDIIVERDNPPTPTILTTPIPDISKRYNIYLRGRTDSKDPNPTTFEKANYMIELSPEYINFLVPPSLQSIMNEAINQTSSDVMDAAMDKIVDVVKDEVVDIEKINDDLNKQVEAVEEDMKTENTDFYKNTNTTNIVRPPAKSGGNFRSKKQIFKRRKTRKNKRNIKSR